MPDLSLTRDRDLPDRIAPPDTTPAPPMSAADAAGLECCALCRFFHTEMVNTECFCFCRRFPPKLITIPADPAAPPGPPRIAAAQVTVGAGQWCGEFRFRK